MLCIFKLFTGDRMWGIQTGERAPLWRTSLIFTRADRELFTPPIMVHQITHYSQYIHYNTPSYWLVHISPLGYIYCDVCFRDHSHLYFICCSYNLNPQVLFYDSHHSYFGYRILKILQNHHTQYLSLIQVTMYKISPTIMVQT